MVKRPPSGLGRSREDYLKALYDLDAGAPVSVSALARRLGVSAPSVTNMLARLADDRLIVLHHRGAARLAREGERLALRVVRRHRILETFLVRVLGCDWAEVHEDAEVLEHHVSDRVLARIDAHLGHPTEDPHGRPIPDTKGRLVKRSLLPLAALARGARARVREIDDEDAARLAHWREIGLVPGAAVRIREVRTLDGVVELEVAGRLHVTSFPSLEGIRVQVARGGSSGT